jgi:hypothetical protein
MNTDICRTCGIGREVFVYLHNFADGSRFYPFNFGKPVGPFGILGNRMSTQHRDRQADVRRCGRLGGEYPGYQNVY